MSASSRRARSLAARAAQLRDLLARIESRPSKARRCRPAPSGREPDREPSPTNDQVARRITVSAHLDDALKSSLAAQPSALSPSETLVSNAASGTTAVISNLYELIEAEGRTEDLIERAGPPAGRRHLPAGAHVRDAHAAARGRSLAEPTQPRAGSRGGDGARADPRREPRILKRRVGGISSDPMRLEQASRPFFQQLVATAAPAPSSNAATFLVSTSRSELARANGNFSRPAERAGGHSRHGLDGHGRQRRRARPPIVSAPVC